MILCMGWRILFACGGVGFRVWYYQLYDEGEFPLDSISIEFSVYVLNEF